MSCRPFVHTQLALGALLLSVPHADAERGSSVIFKHSAPGGTPIYSSSPLSKDQKTTSLPKITKADNVLSQHQSLQQSAADTGAQTTCESKGGIDCSRGEVSTNGGVYCFDGSEVEIQQFSEYCALAELQENVYVTFDSEPKQRPLREVFKNLRAVDPRPISGFVVEIRNKSGVKAKLHAVYLKLPFLSPRRVAMKGADTIAPYGLELYTLTTKELPVGNTPRHIAEAKVQLDCNNCK